MNAGRQVRIFRVDAFTSELFTGNPAGVVLDAEALDEREMQLIAREFGGIDSAFVLPPDAADHDLRLRFFTPHAESAFVGHATIAVHAVRAALGLPACRRQKQRSGIVDIGHGAVDIAHGIVDTSAGAATGGSPAREPVFSFRQPPPPVQGTFEQGRLAAVLEALGIRAADLDPGCPAVVAGPGGSRLLLCVRGGATLALMKPVPERLAALSAAGCPPGYFVYTLAPAVADCDTEARMFCPAIGIDEDPVSGNAHALLAMHLHALGRMPVRSGRAAFTGRQGHHLGRPGRVHVELEQDGPAVSGVRVAGAARIVFAAGIALPGVSAPA